MYLPKVFLLVGCLGLAGSQACAESDFTASFRLRGGFDSNPLFSIGQSSGSAFVAADTALAAGMKADGYTLGVAAEATATHYAQRASADHASAWRQGDPARFDRR